MRAAKRGGPQDAEGAVRMAAEWHGTDHRLWSPWAKKRENIATTSRDLRDDVAESARNAELAFEKTKSRNSGSWPVTRFKHPTERTTCQQIPTR